MRARISILIGVVWLFSTLSTFAQTDYTVELAQVDDSDYPRITLYVSVTDADGKPVGGLKEAEFSVLEDGHQVPILDFAGIGDDRPVDIVFVFDTTSSMSEEIDGVKRQCVIFAEELENKGRDYRLGLVTFGDEIRGIYNGDGTLTNSVQEFKQWIEQLRARGGNDGPELALDAMVKGSQMRFRDDVQRILILLTDAPPHHRSDPTNFSDLMIDETLQMLEAAHITLFAVAPDLSELPEKDNIWRMKPGRYGLPASNEYGRMTGELGGKFYNIAQEPDFTGIIDEIGGLIASQYRLTYESARPSHDGTRRGITVQVGKAGGGGGEARGGYLEKHLLNIRSQPLVGGIFLALLLVILIVPVLWGRMRSVQLVDSLAPGSTPTTVPHRPPPSAAAPVQSPTACPQCGRSLRTGARFCGGCGFTLTGPAAPPQPQTVVCPVCSQTLRPGARFCGHCGNRL